MNMYNILHLPRQYRDNIINITQGLYNQRITPYSSEEIFILNNDVDSSPSEM